MVAASLAELITLSVAAATAALRAVLLVIAGLTAMYAKTPARRAAAERLATLLLSLPWHRSGIQTAQRSPTGRAAK